MPIMLQRLIHCCPVRTLTREAAHADVAIAYGKGKGLVMVKGEVVANLDEKELVDKFVDEVEKMAGDK